MYAKTEKIKQKNAHKLAAPYSKERPAKNSAKNSDDWMEQPSRVGHSGRPQRKRAPAKPEYADYFAAAEAQRRRYKEKGSLFSYDRKYDGRDGGEKEYAGQSADSRDERDTIEALDERKGKYEDERLNALLRKKFVQQMRRQQRAFLKEEDDPNDASVLARVLGLPPDEKDELDEPQSSQAACSSSSEVGTSNLQAQQAQDRDEMSEIATRIKLEGRSSRLSKKRARDDDEDYQPDDSEEEEDKEDSDEDYEESEEESDTDSDE